MLVYVLNQNGKPLMPCTAVKARILLKQEKAKAVRKEPFTIQLLYGSSGYKQDITLGVDAGAKHIGLSASTKKRELYSADVELRTDIVDLISTRRELRRSRRNRKTRYRKARFDNRKKSEGWVAPSIENRINAHISVIEKVHRILPITAIIVETASFDIQKIKNPEIQGAEYQQGEQLGFWNVREYVLFRDNHKCQHCGGKSKDKVLIAENFDAERLPYYWYQKQVRKNTRQIHKIQYSKGGVRKRNQTPYIVFGFRLFDKIKYKGQTCFIYGRRASGSFYLKKLDGTTISGGTTYKKLRLIVKRKTFITERREVAPYPYRGIRRKGFDEEIYSRINSRVIGLRIIR